MTPQDPRDPDRPHGHFSLVRSVPLSQYNVVLHRDATKSLLFVVHTLMELTRYCREEATTRMWQAYHLGRAVVFAVHLERAELYAEQFAARGLPVSLEPA
jgi:ATP-dependent Clp protease adaptor protein ClpS